MGLQPKPRRRFAVDSAIAVWAFAVAAQCKAQSPNTTATVAHTVTHSSDDHWPAFVPTRLLQSAIDIDDDSVTALHLRPLTAPTMPLSSEIVWPLPRQPQTTPWISSSIVLRDCNDRRSSSYEQAWCQYRAGRWVQAAQQLAQSLNANDGNFATAARIDFAAVASHHLTARWLIDHRSLWAPFDKDETDFLIASYMALGKYTQATELEDDQRNQPVQVVDKFIDCQRKARRWRTTQKLTTTQLYQMTRADFYCNSARQVGCDVALSDLSLTAQHAEFVLQLCTQRASRFFTLLNLRVELVAHYATWPTSELPTSNDGFKRWEETFDVARQAQDMDPAAEPMMTAALFNYVNTAPCQHELANHGGTVIKRYIDYLESQNRPVAAWLYDVTRITASNCRQYKQLLLRNLD
jgi:hypothetical protein